MDKRKIGDLLLILGTVLFVGGAVVATSDDFAGDVLAGVT